MSPENRQRLLGIAAITAVVLLAGDRLVLTPLLGAWKTRSDRIAELQRSVNQGELLLDRESAIRDRWDFMRTNTLAGEATEAEGQVLKAFERWAQASRIGISAVKPQWRRGGADYVTLDCRVEAFGSLAALTRFLYDLEKDPLALKVELVEITARDARGDQLALTLQVSGLLLNSVALR